MFAVDMLLLKQPHKARLVVTLFLVCIHFTLYARSWISNPNVISSYLLLWRLVAINNVHMTLDLVNARTHLPFVPFHPFTFSLIILINFCREEQSNEKGSAHVLQMWCSFPWSIIFVSFFLSYFEFQIRFYVASLKQINQIKRIERRKKRMPMQTTKRNNWMEWFWLIFSFDCDMLNR